MITCEVIQPHHRERRAAVYLRQSSPQQVLHHTESLKLQYALREHALQYGWAENDIDVIDTDLGLTGSSSVGRAGFQELVTQVTLGHIGIIFAYDVTRLSRNCTDWYQLLDLCSYRQCLVGDQEGIYDPATPNGRLILGLKGLMAELELHTIKARLHAGLINKARRGDLALSLPVGLVRDLSGRVVFHPNEEVRDRVAFVFTTFQRVKSIHGLVREMSAADLLLPRRDRGRDDGAVVWRRPTAAAISSLLRNPAYSGTFVYGRSRFLSRVPNGPKRKHPLAQEQWQFMVPDKYPAYIDRETYATIQGILRDNYLEYERRQGRGAARSGSALLQGLVYCGHCGRKMTVAYQSAARYICNGHKMQMGGNECQRLPMTPIDSCVAENFWAALEPAELAAFDEALGAFDEQQRQLDHAVQQQLQRLRYEAQLAEKQYRLVDPENRLVAAELERRWELALQAVQQAEAAHTIKVSVDPLTIELRQQLAEGRPTLRQWWDEGRLTNVRKKELLRVLIDKVILQRPASDRCELRIVWRGGDWTSVTLSLPVVTYAEMTDGDALISEVLRRARAGQSDAQIAVELTGAGYHAPLKDELSKGSVARIRHKHAVISRKSEFLRQGMPAWITIGQAVERLGEHKAWVYYMIRQERLQITRDPEIGFYLIPNDKNVLKELKELLRGKRFSLTIQPRLP